MTLTVYTYGKTFKNSNCISSYDNQSFKYSLIDIPNLTNIEAEYCAVVYALQRSRCDKDILILSSSELVISELKGEIPLNSDISRYYRGVINEFIILNDYTVKYAHIRKKDNIARELLNAVLSHLK